MRDNKTFRNLAGAGALLATGTASASPLAASVSSAPLVVGGVVVGLILLSGFTMVLIRSFRSMKSSQGETRLDIARRVAGQLVGEFELKPSVAPLKGLVDELRESASDEEARVYSAALSRITGRYFGEDDVAWEVWLRRDAGGFVGTVAAPVSQGSDSRSLPVNG